MAMTFKVRCQRYTTDLASPISKYYITFTDDYYTRYATYT